MKNVNQPFRKKDAMQLVTGKPVYMDDLAPADCLIVKLLRSPHPNAIVKTINTTVAKKVPGIEAIFTWEDVDQNGRRYTQAGQTYPEASPYDRLVIDRHVRFVGDVVAIVAGVDDRCVDKAMKLIKVEYEVLEPVLDFHTAKDNPILVHPEDNWESLCPVGADNKRNLCAHDECGSGDIDAVLADCDVVIDHVYHTKACQQAMMETFRTCCYMDLYGRLNILSSTQIVFHTRRNVANALHIPKSMIRVIKPRVGGGFGARLGQAVGHDDEVPDVLPVEPQGEERLAVVDPVGDDPVDLDDVLVELDAGLFDEAHPVQLQLVDALHGDILRHGQNGAVLKAHALVDILKISLDGRADQAEIADDPGVFFFVQPVVNV